MAIAYDFSQIDNTDNGSINSGSQRNENTTFAGKEKISFNPHFSDCGLFITFEGVDGSGKTTQIKNLTSYLEEKGYLIGLTREPGGTALGKGIRHLLLDKTDGMSVCPRAEALLYAADRAQNIEEKVEPILKKGGIALSDRYMDSSLAYQSKGRHLGQVDIYNISLWAARGLVPQRIYLLDMDPLHAQKRYLSEHEDRIESEGLEFQRNVRQAFLRLSELAPEQWCVINAAKSPSEVWEDIKKDIDYLLASEKFRDLTRM